MNIKKLMTIAVASLTLAFGANANAGMILTLYDGTTTVTVSDGGTGDLDPTTGHIMFVGTVGRWILNVALGESNSPANTAPAFVDLGYYGNFEAQSRGAGTLIVTLTEIGPFASRGSNVGAITDVGGIQSNGTVAFQSKVNNTLLANFAPFTSGAFSGSQSGQVDTTGGFSLTNVATITHDNSGYTQFGMRTTVPEPAALGLLGVGLIGLAFMRKRRASESVQ